MPTVPRQSPVEESRESILGSRGVGWPIGQQRTLREEIWRQTAKAQDPVEAGGLVRIKPKAWEKFISESPKTKNIEERTTPAPDLKPYEKQAYKQYTKDLDKAYLAKPDQPEPVSPLAKSLGQGSMKGIATKEMGLNEQEQFLYQHHLDNLAKGGVPSEGGKTSTVLAITVGQDDKTSVIPTVWDNKIVSKDQAIANADKAGWDKFPSYDSREEAKDRYFKMHDYMDKDIQ